ncbi:amidohydrolase family protein [bacterium]|nr:amidohydrolase family protein [bacterium]
MEARWVLPIAAPPIKDGAILVDSTGEIVQVGKRDEVRRAAPAGVERIDAGELVHPALVNAHLHLELSALAGALAGGRGLVAWVRELIARRAPLDAKAVAHGVALAVSELLSCGTGALGDTASGLAGNELPEDAPFLGARFHEALGAKPEDWEKALASARDRARAPSGNLRAALAAHAPATCSEELLAAVASASAGEPVSVHLAEDPAERRLLVSGDGAWAELLRERGIARPFSPERAASPVRVAARAGLLGPRTLAVHLLDVDDDDVRELAASGASAVLCPRSNRFLGLGAPPASKLAAAGVPLALGTDSLASSPSLNVLEEAAALAIDPVSALRAATLGGARALGEQSLGAFVPGARPGIVARDAVVGARRPEAALLEQPRASARWIALPSRAGSVSP